MKKTIVFSLMGAALMISACSSDSDTIANEETQKRGMKLNAVVPENLRSRATIGDTENDTWTFAFSNDDQAKVTNSNMSNYYTFTKSAEEFGCATAEPTSSPANWYAYFPSTEVSLTNQTGSVADLANKFALAGKTSSATTGEEGLTINMDAKVAILVIDNQKGAIDINIKNSATTWVTGLSAKDNEAAFDVTTSTTKASILNKSENGKYYIAVPAGVQLAIKNGAEVIKSTIAEGLEAGKYYNLELNNTCCCPDENHPHTINLGLPSGIKFACENVGAQHPHEYGDYFAWAATEPWYIEGHAYDSPCESWKTGKTGYIWVDAPYQTINTTNYSLTKWTKYVGPAEVFKDPSATDSDANKEVLDLEDDAAYVIWGDKWRIPTDAEWTELRTNCYWVWTSNYLGTGKAGRIVFKAKTDADKGRDSHSYTSVATYDVTNDIHIFLPAAGERVHKSYNTYGLDFYGSGSVGAYWSSLLDTTYNYAWYVYYAYFVHISPEYIIRSSTNRCSGLSIRPVCP